jgi:hypothetical protein
MARVRIAAVDRPHVQANFDISSDQNGGTLLRDPVDGAPALGESWSVPANRD